jgi:predicted nucleotide-binding protein
LGGKMYYHVKIKQKSGKTVDELKFDLSEEELRRRFIIPYENNENIVINGIIIPPDNIERIQINKTEMSSSELIPIIQTKRLKETASTLLSNEWYVTKEGKDVTDDFISGPSGYKIKESKEKMMDPIPQNNQIFVVHGHDEKIKYELEIFLNEIGLDPLILHRKPDEGLTIIEKFEKYSNVSFSIIILTPDDIAYSSSDDEKTDESCQKEYRARQNVIFEFGYFVGKLGRNRVCCLYKEGVELPSDIHGLLYKKINNSVEDIGFSLIKELKLAGYDLKI